MQAVDRRPHWHRLSLALLAAFLAIGLKLIVDAIFRQSLTPYLPAFAAIMVSASISGFSGGVVTTALVTGWAVYSQPHGNTEELSGTALRAGILFFEGLLLSAGFERMRKTIRQSASSENWHRKLLATASEGIWVIGPGMRVTFANERIAEMLGYTVQEMVGTMWECYFFPQDIPMERIRCNCAGIAPPAPIAAQFDRRLRRKDGSELWVLTCINTFVDLTSLEGGAGQNGYLAMMTDITERKTAETALRHSETRFRTLFENVLEGVYQSTRDGRILAANPMLYQMLGLNKTDLNQIEIGRDLYVDPACRLRNVEILEAEGILRNAEYQLRRPDGQIVHVMENARVVRDHDGRTLFYEGTLIDLTEKKEMESRAQHSAQIQAFAKFSAACSANIAHNWNDMMTVVSGHARLALESLEQDHPAQRHLRQLLQCHEEAAVLSRRLLSVSASVPEAESVTHSCDSQPKTSQALPVL